MKNSWTILAFALSAAAAGAQTPLPQGETRAPQIAGAQQNTDAAAALDALAAKLRSGKLEAANFEMLKTAIQQRPEASAPDPQARVVTARLQRAIEGLQMRAEKGSLKAQHLDALREQLIDEKIDRALEQLGSSPAPSGSTAIALETVATLVERRADASRSFDPNADEMRAQVQRELKALEQKATDKPLPPEALTDFRAMLTDLRLAHAVNVVESMAAANDLTAVELARVRGIVDDHAARNPGDTEFQRIREQMTSKLDELEPLLKSGSIDASEVAKLREPLRSTREASSPRGEAPKKPQ